MSGYNQNIDYVVDNINKILKEKKLFFYLSISENGGFDTIIGTANNTINIFSNIERNLMYYNFDFKYTKNTNFIEVSDHRNFKYQIMIDNENIEKFTNILIHHMTILDKGIKKISKIFNVMSWYGIHINIPTSKYTTKYIIYYVMNDKNFLLQKYNFDRDKLKSVYGEEQNFGTIDFIDNISEEILRKNPELKNTILNKIKFWLGFIKS